MRIFIYLFIYLNKTDTNLQNEWIRISYLMFANICSIKTDWKTDTVTTIRLPSSVFSDIGCEQIVDFPTRIDNILDIFGIERLPLIDRRVLLPGISDRDVVLVGCPGGGAGDRGRGSRQIIMTGCASRILKRYQKYKHIILKIYIYIYIYIYPK